MKTKTKVTKKNVSKINRGKHILSNIKPNAPNTIANVISESDANKKYNISYEYGHLYCDCNKIYTGTKTTSCKHISAIILQILEGFKGESINNINSILDKLNF